MAGVTSGIMRLGDSVTWRAKHFGVTQRLTSKITRFERPRMFRDSMVQGAFRRFDHDHIFEPAPNGTRMIDVFDYDAPLGLLGRLPERTFLNRYMLRLLQTRNAHLKEALEGDRWRAFLDSR